MKPSIPKGTRDFLPAEVRRREYIFAIIRKHFRRFGYQPIETPVMEDLQTLTGKYGEEGDKLLFKVLNNGDFLSKADENDLANRDSNKLVGQISKRGLRYDLTVPFARYVVMHQNDLAFPFKRYAIMPVWRADRPQKGRYQEFYQCDADVVGSDSLLYEAELTQLFDGVFHELGLRVIIRLNNRKILAGLAEIAGLADNMMDMTIAIDKLDKIGWDKVAEELTGRGAAPHAIQIIKQFLDASDLEAVAPLLAGSAIGGQGVKELREVFGLVAAQSPKNRVVFDVTLARGLNYYTGAIWEVAVDTDAPGQENVRMGSIAGGGRYADLTSIFGMKDMPGVGISFGAERIYDVLEELGAFPADAAEDLQYLLLCLDEDALQHGFGLVSRLRARGIHADLYPSAAKLQKMMKYADQRGVPKVLIIGSEEVKSGAYSLKVMGTGEQSKVTEAAL
ncbi:histidine--tRNA ligase [Neolewinella lacunae]|uniref:Histidine--tRNA ligase n=1 Tax=Neolewinella lacunae TaxID=1517758 RepID=A0A923PN57_9BACT|nr:histidine--tRNA ligase [Neolewinella lacunae]MBC6995781.1 histidine--tRNA ligase [Neolewinella lacunae]MDN3636526.1 histidine--tRNA ligase [Neolewinella lacunae]